MKKIFDCLVHKDCEFHNVVREVDVTAIAIVTEDKNGEAHPMACRDDRIKIVEGSNG